jgi:hypothetical protein
VRAVSGPTDPFLQALNEAFGDAAVSLGLGTRMPSYRFWKLKAGESHNRYAREYCYATQKSKGPDGGPVGFYAFVYEVHPRGGGAYDLVLKRSVRFRHRYAAKARAYRWYATAKGRPPEQRVLQRRATPTPPVPTTPPGPAPPMLMGGA